MNGGIGDVDIDHSWENFFLEGRVTYALKCKFDNWGTVYDKMHCAMFIFRNKYFLTSNNGMTLLVDTEQNQVLNLCALSWNCNRANYKKNKLVSKSCT